MDLFKISKVEYRNGTRILSQVRLFFTKLMMELRYILELKKEQQMLLIANSPISFTCQYHPCRFVGAIKCKLTRHGRNKMCSVSSLAKYRERLCRTTGTWLFSTFCCSTITLCNSSEIVYPHSTHINEIIDRYRLNTVTTPITYKCDNQNPFFEPIAGELCAK